MYWPLAGPACCNSRANRRTNVLRQGSQPQLRVRPTRKETTLSWFLRWRDAWWEIDSHCVCELYDIFQFWKQWKHCSQSENWGFVIPYLRRHLKIRHSQLIGVMRLYQFFLDAIIAIRGRCIWKIYRVKYDCREKFNLNEKYTDIRNSEYNFQMLQP